MNPIPDTHRDLLQTTTLAHLATMAPDGELQCTPVWFAWDGEHERLSQPDGSELHRNMQQHPRIALTIVDPTTIYRSLEMRGRVIRYEADPDFQFVGALAHRYQAPRGRTSHQPRPPRIIVVVQPEFVTTTG